MKAVQINNYGGSQVVEINENAPKPAVSQGHLLRGKVVLKIRED